MGGAVKSIITSKIVHFIFTRYFGYLVLFANSILFAKYLGTYYLGIYGFLTLMLQYLSYGNFGVQYALNFFLSTNNDKSSNNRIYSNAFFILIAFAFTILSFFVILEVFDLRVFTKYHFNKYYLLVGAIAVLQILNQLFINIYRTYGTLWQINFHQIILPVVQIMGLLLFTGEALLNYIITALLVGNLLALALFLVKNPLSITWKIEVSLIKKILLKGINLLIYNISFYLIMLSGRTLVGIFYSVEEMGFYSFASNLSNAVMMVMGSISFLFFSKLVNRINKLEGKEELSALIEKSRSLYLIMTFIIGFSFFLLMPYLVYLLPEYSESFTIFKYLILSQMILANVFGYSTLLVAKQKEKTLTFNAFVAVIINLLLAGIIIFYDQSYILIGLTTLVSVIYYNVKSVHDGNKITNQFKSWPEILRYLFPLGVSLPMVFLGTSVVLDLAFLAYIGYGLFLIMNYPSILSKFKLGLDLIGKKTILDL